ncbi:hypothetical protein [Pedobacter faecalis]|uniref:hypothetical protein n=1 Tax=Pedobacter faecalis TaxID=3041495 RepID=UPI00254B4141|nr:hypothetical protein [Pedobacter sp. ELA7]
MKILNRLLLGVSLALVCVWRGQTQDLSGLKKAFADVQVDGAAETRVRFFREFPSSFNTFQRVFGFDDVKGEAPLFSTSEKYISAFFVSVIAVRQDQAINKLISISKNGHWDADAVNYFQKGLRKFYSERPGEFVSILRTKSVDDISGFWYFFLDEPHFNKKLYNQTVKSLGDLTHLKNI